MRKKNRNEVGNKHEFVETSGDMRNGNQKFLNWLRFLIDVCIIIIAYLSAYFLRFHTPFFSQDLRGLNYRADYLSLLIYVIPMFLLVYYVFRLYSPILNKRKWLEISNILLANILSIAFFMALLYFLSENNISRKFIVLFLIINITLCISIRRLFSYYLKRRPRK